MATYNKDVAMVAGVNAGIIADLLIDILEEDEDNVKRWAGKDWCRCSMKCMSIYCPFLTVGQVRYAIKQLRDNGIIVSRQFGKSVFDNTNWYAFTEYGQKLIEWK